LKSNKLKQIRTKQEMSCSPEVVNWMNECYDEVVALKERERERERHIETQETGAHEVETQEAQEAQEEETQEEEAQSVEALSGSSDERKGKGEIEVEFIKHTKRVKGAPDGSKGRDLYCFSANGVRKEKDCWHWWRGDDDIVRILGGGGSRRPKQPTIYYFKIKGEKLSCCQDKDQSKSWDLYNQYGRK
jgi:hypothetical protein